MENTVTITLAEWQRLDGLDRQFDEKLKAAVRERIDADRAFVLRDRDEYVRRNESLRAENQRLRDSAGETAGTGDKLRLDLGKAEKRIADLEGALRIASAAVDVAKEDARKRSEAEKALRDTEKALRDEVGDLRKERRDLLLERDALLGRGLLARIFNWR